MLVFVDSIEHSFDILTQYCILKVLEPLLMYILKNFQKTHMCLDLGFWITV